MKRNASSSLSTKLTYMCVRSRGSKASVIRGTKGNDQMSKTDSHSELSQDDARRISRVFAILEAFREVAPTLPASYAQAFLAVAMKPGQPSGAYAKAIGMIQPVASRILLEIGKKTRTGGPGLELVESVEDLQDLRIKRYYLTAKGRKLIKDITVVMARDEKAHQ